jgi:hypothetical protein
MKLIFEGWRQYLSEELLTEVTFEKAKLNVDGKRLRKAILKIWTNYMTPEYYEKEVRYDHMQGEVEFSKAHPKYNELARTQGKTPTFVVSPEYWNQWLRNIDSEFKVDKNTTPKQIGDEFERQSLENFIQDTKRNIIDYVKDVMDLPPQTRENDRGLILLWVLRLFRNDDVVAISMVPSRFSKANAPESIDSELLDPEGIKNLELFFIYKQFMKEKSLMNIENFQQLSQIVGQAKDKIEAYQEKKQSANVPQNTEVLMGEMKGSLERDKEGEYKDKLRLVPGGDGVAIAAIHSKGASCYWGKGTDWCTAAPGMDFFDEYYRKDSPLFYFQEHSADSDNVARYQFSYHSQQFMDSSDRPVDWSTVLKFHKLLKKTSAVQKYKEIFSEDSEVQKWLTKKEEDERVRQENIKIDKEHAKKHIEEFYKLVKGIKSDEDADRAYKALLNTFRRATVTVDQDKRVTRTRVIQPGTLRDLGIPTGFNSTIQDEFFERLPLTGEGFEVALNISYGGYDHTEHKGWQHPNMKKYGVSSGFNQPPHEILKGILEKGKIPVEFLIYLNKAKNERQPGMGYVPASLSNTISSILPKLGALIYKPEWQALAAEATTKEKAKKAFHSYYQAIDNFGKWNPLGRMWEHEEHQPELAKKIPAELLWHFAKNAKDSVEGSGTYTITAQRAINILKDRGEIPKEEAEEMEEKLFINKSISMPRYMYTRRQSRLAGGKE